MAEGVTSISRPVGMIEGHRENKLPRRVIHVLTVPDSILLMRGQPSYMRAAGLDVHVVASPGPTLSTKGAEEGVTVHAVEMPRRITPISDLRAVITLVSLFRKLRPDIVHAHTPKGGLLGMLAAVIARVPRRIYHMRGLPLETARGPRRALLRATEWIACRAAHRVICVSHSLRGVAMREGLAKASKLKVLGGGSGNGVDAIVRFSPDRTRGHREAVRNTYSITADAVVILFIGRLATDKGVGDLADAWQTVRHNCPNAFLLVAGPHEERDGISPAVIDRLTGDSRVRLLTGWVDTPPLYAAADIVVLPSHREGFPNVPLEAAAMELPVVVTDATGCAESAAHGVTGQVVPVADSRALAAAMEYYVTRPDERRRHGVAGRIRVLEQFQQPVVWGALLHQYRALLRWRRYDVSGARRNH